MGVDKALLDVEGCPMVVRVADALWEAGCDPVVCQGGADELTSALGLQVVPDPDPGAGPVSAILAALQHADGPIVVAACDLVDLDAEAVRLVIDAGSQSAAPTVAVAVTDGRSHLLSFWPAEALASLESLVAEGVSAYRGVLERLEALAVPVAEHAVRNVNRPEDLA
jgi:molybdopterin-guanine dinucleotide biosynthesis protein A